MCNAIINNYAFIDAQNIEKGVRALGWRLDWSRFRIYLKEKYSVSVAFIFIGYVETNAYLYDDLYKSGYKLIFKPIIKSKYGETRGNCDADLVLQAMIEFSNYNKAIIASSDGDFYSLVRYLYSKDKLRVVLSSHTRNCSALLKVEGKEKIHYLNNLKSKLDQKGHRIRTKPL